MSKKDSKLFKFDLEALLMSDASGEEKEGVELPKSEVSAVKVPTKKRKVTNKTTARSSKECSSSANHEIEENDDFDVTKIVSNFSNDFNKSMKAKKLRIENFINSINDVCQKSVVQMQKTQEDEIEEFKKKHVNDVNVELEKWEDELNHIKEQQDKLLKMFQQQAKLLQNTSIAQEERHKIILKLHKNFIQKFGELKMKHKNELHIMKEKLNQEIQDLQKKFLSDTQKEEMTIMKKSLNTIFF